MNDFSDRITKEPLTPRNGNATEGNPDPRNPRRPHHYSPRTLRARLGQSAKNADRQSSIASGHKRRAGTLITKAAEISKLERRHADGVLGALGIHIRWADRGLLKNLTPDFFTADESTRAGRSVYKQSESL